MAQLISVKLSRFDGSPWGFRLQGGKDFGTPLIVQKVNGGSPAEAAGLKAGDAVIRVNSTDMYNLRHKDAQDVIVKAGNNFEITVQRGGGTWKPHVTPLTSSIPSPSPTGNITPVTKTSLAAKKQDGPLIGSGHNFSPKPFLNGTGDGPIKSIVNKQYNSPVGIYSEETIAETLSAQAEVLAGGVLGVNFKKNEKNYNAENSEVFKMVQEADKEPKTPEPAEPTAQSGVITPSSPALAGLRPVSAPETKPQPSTPQTSLPPGQNICAECERLIVGVFVRIKEKNLHVECFKCSTCGTSLKNVGYYNINNKLYCDIHAKLVARQNAPAGMIPVTVPPKAPASTISAALANAPLSPPLSNHTSSPLPFSACNRTSPDRGSHHPRRSSLTRNGCIRNGECNGESKTFTSTITIQTGGTEPTRLGTSPVDPPSVRSVQAPTNSLIGPKPFGASSNLSSPPILNSGSSTLSRQQSQTVTGPADTFSETQENYYYYKVIEETTSNSTNSPFPTSNPENPNPSNPSSTPNTWSPSNPSNPSNPTNPNSVKSRSLTWPPPKPEEESTYPTASPLYIDPNPALDRRGRQAVKEKKASIEACERALRHRSQSRDRDIYYRQDSVMDSVSCPGPLYRKVELVDASTERQSREVSRPSSTDSVRRSLTPTRIVQPIPRPWTATVTSGSNLYEQTYPIPEPPKVCTTYTEQEVCKREKIERVQPHREEHRAYRAEVCRREQIITKPPIPAKEEKKEYIKEVDTEVTDLRPPDDEETPGGITGEHDLVTETSDETVGNMHIKKTMTFEKTMEPVSQPEREPSPQLEETEQIITRRTETHVDREVEREVESITERKTVSESAETVTSAVEATKMIEQAMRDEEERKRIEAEEERRRQEEEERKKREEEERRRREEEERIRREEEERTRKHVSFSEEEVEEVREQPLGRTVVREERVTETDTTPGRCKVTKETYEEITEEVLVQERVRRKPIGDEERRRSLREQVEVHQSLRDQQPDRKRMSSKYGQGQETMETCKKHVQFMKQTESGPKPIPSSAVKNATAQEWKSEMVNALTTASDRPYTPLSTSSSVKELYTEETIYLDHRGQPIKQEPQEEIRPISPFQEALTIAPERSYTPLSRPVGPEDVQVGGRAQTPIVQVAEKYPPPADILYGEGTYRSRETHEKVCQEKPRPLPTPPPGYHLRDSSASPVRSRSTTPCAGTNTKPSSVRLRKPDTIPAYQRNLVAMKKEPVEGQPYIPSRTPTPTCGRTKSPAQARSPQIPCHSKVQAPRIKDPSPPQSYTMKAPRIKESAPPVSNSVSASVHFPKRKGVAYHVEEDTDTGHRKQEYAASRSVRYDEKQSEQSPNDGVHAQYQEHRYMTSEETSEEQGGSSYCKKALHVVEDFERCEKKKESQFSIEDSKPSVPKPESKGKCAISTVTDAPSTLPCPMSSGTASRAIQPSYSSTSEVRHVRYDTPSPKTCPETGVTVLPCKAVSDRGSKAGVVVVPCEGPKTPCAKSGVCVVPTPDRSGVCVSPCFGSRPSDSCVRSGGCGQPSGCCGRQSSCDFDAPGCPESGICVTPCADGSVCVAPCAKSSLKSQCGGSSRASIPYPQIPLPYEERSSGGCSNGGCSPPCDEKERAFEPIYKPRTNLSGQLARLTAKSQNIPTVQLYKPIQNCQTQNHCQDQYHCPASKTQSLVDPPNLSSHPDLGAGIGGLGGAGSKSGSFAGSSAPKRGRGILNQAGGPGSRVPLCGHCNSYVRGPFITALGQIWCPDHFVCVNTQCRRPLQDIGFVEEKGQLYCEYCFEKFIAPTCNKCNNKIKGDCLNAIGKHFHPECFNCAYCGKLFGNSPFFLEEGLPYCEADWNELFTTKCFACGFPVEAGDRWVEALNNNYHSQCFNCTMCKKNLEGQSFYAKGGRPFCKNHAR